jgi:hypothetical protein
MSVFDHPHLSFQVSVAPEVEAQFNAIVSVSPVTWPFYPRFVAQLLKVPQKSLPDPGFLDELKRNMRSETGTFRFGGRLVEHRMCELVTRAVIFGNEVKTVEFVGGGLAQYVPIIRLVLFHSESVESLVFEKVVFIGEVGLDLVDKNSFCTVRELRFVECSLADHTAISFFEAFRRYPEGKVITCLSFLKCIFSAGVLDALFSHCLLYFPCFHDLKSFTISSAANAEILKNSILQLATSNWVIEGKSLQTISVCHSQIELSLLLPLLIRVDTGVKVLDLSGNRWDRPMKSADIKSFQSIRSLSLASCKFGAGVLESLFQCLSLSAQTRPLRLDLSSAKLAPASWNSFFQVLPTLEIPGLAGLHWNYNPIREQHSEAFLAFLQRQPKLRELSLTDSITAGSQSLLRGIATFRTLTHFSVAAERSPPAAFPLRPFILKFIQNNAIEFLDVTGHPIGEATVFSILDAAEKLTDFRFDRITVTNCEALIAVLRRVIDAKTLRVASWPATEMTQSLRRSPVMARVRLYRELDALRAEFVKRFGKHDRSLGEFGRFLQHEIEVLGPDVAADDATRCAPGGQPIPRRPPLSELFDIMEEFVEHDAEVLALLEECADVPGCDPMETLGSEAEQLTDIPTLAAQLSSAE